MLHLRCATCLTQTAHRSTNICLMLSWGVSIKWSCLVGLNAVLVAHGIKGKFANRNNVVFLEFASDYFKCTPNPQQRPHYYHALIFASKQNSHPKCTSVQYQFFFLLCECKQLSEQLKCTLQINFCKMHSHPDRMLYSVTKQKQKYTEFRTCSKNCVKHLKKVAKKVNETLFIMTWNRTWV